MNFIDYLQKKHQSADMNMVKGAQLYQQYGTIMVMEHIAEGDQDILDVAFDRVGDTGVNYDKYTRTYHVNACSPEFDPIAGHVDMSNLPMYFLRIQSFPRAGRKPAYNISFKKHT